MSEVVENGNEASEAPKSLIPKAKLGEIHVTKYMESCLDKVALAEGFKNYIIKVNHGSGIGDGFVGIIFKVSIVEKESDKFLNVVLKTPPESEARRNQFGSMQLFKREIFMYNEVLPEFVKFQREKKISESSGFYNFPKIYFAEYDLEKDDALIIMEDLRESGYQLWNKYKPTDFEHSKLIMTSLGRLHAISFAMKKFKPELFEEYKKLDDFLSPKFTDPHMAPIFRSNADQAMNILDEDDTDLKSKVENIRENFADFMTWLTNPQSAEPFAVVTHGDCWSNNFMYKYKGGNVDKVCLLDFQVSRYCSPILDLVYFIFVCTDGEMRKIHYDELLTIYHRSLKDMLDHMGGDTTTQFPFTAFLREMKKFGKFGVIMAMFLIPMMTTKAEDMPDLDFIAETSTTEQDPETLKQMMMEFMSKNVTYKNRMKSSLIDSSRYGYIEKCI